MFIFIPLGQLLTQVNLRSFTRLTDIFVNTFWIGNMYRNYFSSSALPGGAGCHARTHVGELSAVFNWWNSHPVPYSVSCFLSFSAGSKKGTLYHYYEKRFDECWMYNQHETRMKTGHRYLTEKAIFKQWAQMFNITFKAPSWDLTKVNASEPIKSPFIDKMEKQGKHRIRRWWWNIVGTKEIMYLVGSVVRQGHFCTLKMVIFSLSKLVKLFEFGVIWRGKPFISYTVFMFCLYRYYRFRFYYCYCPTSKC